MAVRTWWAGKSRGRARNRRIVRGVMHAIYINGNPPARRQIYANSPSRRSTGCEMAFLSPFCGNSVLKPGEETLEVVMSMGD
mmetsp:Transcript_74054/g.163741  ORF Transcript_74054/g.163741 Transcript_74054/m.163741 type:complete len:82 (-) Transcript_74054:848-1093(-)